MSIADYLSGFPAFIAHFILAIGYLVAYLAIYTAVTRHDEWALLKQGNIAAAIALGGSVLGFSLPLAASVEYSDRSSTTPSGRWCRWSCRSASIS